MLRLHRFSRFLTGGMGSDDATSEPPEDRDMFSTKNEALLDQALTWRDDLLKNPPRVFDIGPEPKKYIWDYDTNEWIENPGYSEWEHEEWQMKELFAQRNISYWDSGDRYKKHTELGYIMNVHKNCGLDVVLRMDPLPNKKGMWDYIDEWTWENDVFTEIITDPTPLFLPLNFSNEFQSPAPGTHFHITLAHSLEVGKAYKAIKGKIAEWKRIYNRVRERYNGKRARLGMDRWGGGYTFYLDSRTKVEGLEHPHNIVDDPDVIFLYDIPGRKKAGDRPHISLLI